MVGVAAGQELVRGADSVVVAGARRQTVHRDLVLRAEAVHGDLVGRIAELGPVDHTRLRCRARAPPHHDAVGRRLLKIGTAGQHSIDHELGHQHHVVE